MCWKIGVRILHFWCFLKYVDYSYIIEMNEKSNLLEEYVNFADVTKKTFLK